MCKPPEREVLRRVLPGLQLVPAHQIRELPEDGAVWLWNSQPISGESVSIGDAVDPERLSEIPFGEPLRLVRIERDLWMQALEPDLQAPEDSPLPEDGVSADDRYADLLPAPQGDLQIAEPDTPRGARQRIPEVTGTGPMGQTMACLEMLARHYNVPFRRDVIERAAIDNSWLFPNQFGVDWHSLHRDGLYRHSDGSPRGSVGSRTISGNWLGHEPADDHS